MVSHVIWISVWDNFVECGRAGSEAIRRRGFVQDLPVLVGHNRVSYAFGRESETHGRDGHSSFVWGSSIYVVRTENGGVLPSFAYNYYGNSLRVVQTRAKR